MDKQEIIDHDNKWKIIIENLFEDFVKYFLPDLHPHVDFRHKPRFLDKEFPELENKDRKGKVINDKLVSVRLKNGKEKWLLIHIEVQSFYEKDFARRMFVYFYRILDKHKKEITAIAIFTGNKNPKKYKEYNYESYGTKLTYQYNIYKVTDAKEEELLASKNPFALAVLTCRYLIKAKKTPKQKYAFKKKLIELALKQKYSKPKIENLLRFIGNLIKLPKNLNDKLFNKMKEQIQATQSQPTEYEKMLADSFARVFGGKTIAQVEEEAEKKIEKIEQEKQQVEQKIKKIEQEKQQAEQERFNAIKKLLQETDLSIKKVAEIFSVSTYYVRKIKKELK